MSNLFLSTSISLRRNFADMPFPGKMSMPQKEISLARVTQAIEENDRLPELDGAFSFKVPAMFHVFQEKPGVGTLIHLNGKPGNISILVNGQDGVMLSITSSGEIDTETVELLYQAENRIFSENPAAWDEQIEYLTARPLFAGTGIQIHYILHLPIMTTLKQISHAATDIEQNKACSLVPLNQADEKNPSCLYVVSNKRTNYSIDDIQKRVREAAEMLSAKEKLLGEKMFSNSESILIDQAFRAYGILKYARRINEREFLTLWSHLRMGAENRVLDVPLTLIDRLLLDALPDESESGKRNISNYLRAERIRRRMEEK